MPWRKIRIAGPLEPYLPGFWEVWIARGYSPLSAKNLARLAAGLSAWMSDKHVELDALTYQHLTAYLRLRRRAGRTGFLSHHALNPIVSVLKLVDAVPSLIEPEPAVCPLGQFLAEYGRHLSEQRALQPRTIYQYLSAARIFLSHHAGPCGIDFDRLSATQVHDFILKQARQSAIGTAKCQVTALRSLFRYLLSKGHLSTDLSTSVPAIAGWRLAGLPKALSPQHVKTLLDSCDRRSHVGRRAYAVLLLMVRMGLRVGEVKALTLDDIDWQQGELLIRGKGRQMDRLPLSAEVGSALASYLRLSRSPVKDRQVFLRTRAPHRAISVGGLKQVVLQAHAQAGLPAQSAHRLRHTAATLMINRGVSLPSIAHALRQRDINTTAIYAKVDRTSLKELAHPWPGELA